MENRLIRPYLAGFVLSRHIECANLISNLVSIFGNFPKKSLTFPDQTKGGLWVLGASRWKRRYNPLTFKEFACLKLI